MWRFVFFVFLSVLAVSCLKREAVEISENPGDIGQQTLRIEVVTCTPASDPFCNQTHPVFQANVALYKSEQSFKNEDEPVRKALTDGAGLVTFTGLNEYRYYTVVFKADHYTEESAAIPPGGIGNLRIVFIE